MHAQQYAASCQESKGERTGESPDLVTDMDLGVILVETGETKGFRLPSCCNVARVGNGAAIAAETSISARTRHVVTVKIDGYVKKMNL